MKQLLFISILLSLIVCIALSCKKSVVENKPYNLEYPVSILLSDSLITLYHHYPVYAKELKYLQMLHGDEYHKRKAKFKYDNDSPAPRFIKSFRFKPDDESALLDQLRKIWNFETYRVKIGLNNYAMLNIEYTDSLKIKDLDFNLLLKISKIINPLELRINGIETYLNKAPDSYGKKVVATVSIDEIGYTFNCNGTTIKKAFADSNFTDKAISLVKNSFEASPILKDTELSHKKNIKPRKGYGGMGQTPEYLYITFDEEAMKVTPINDLYKFTKPFVKDMVLKNMSWQKGVPGTHKPRVLLKDL